MTIFPNAAKRKIAVVVGTRPEAIKMAPVYLALRDQSEIEPILIVTAQHRQLMDSVLTTFGMTPDVDLNLMKSNQSLSELSARILTSMGRVFTNIRPDAVLVHGDTTTCLCSTLAAFYEKIPIGHVEAGLRSGNLLAPWPEEMNRRLVDPLCQWCFAPTQRARQNLLAENIPEDRIHVTGNTIVDALIWIRNRLPERMRISGIPSETLKKHRLILVTGHRRESFGEGIRGVCLALKRIVDRHQDIFIVYPVHLNPNVYGPVHDLLGGHPRIRLIDPVDYPTMVYLMEKSCLIITDSGGIQEEAPALNKPVLVTRSVTERPEAMEQGLSRLVGTSPDQIVQEADEVLGTRTSGIDVSPISNPFGDGQAAPRIAGILVKDK